MTAFLPPNLIALFAPRDPIEFKEGYWKTIFFVLKRAEIKQTIQPWKDLTLKIFTSTDYLTLKVFKSKKLRTLKIFLTLKKFLTRKLFNPKNV